MPVDSPGQLIASRLLDHYDRHARKLPWRAMPGAERAEPYHVWLSEIMLQQTTVAAVAPYFLKFLKLWPTVEALAAADDADVMSAWAGLGYYARARNLLACARMVTNEYGGTFPATEAGLRVLPGIGPYTAAAIAAIAFGTHAVVVDANVERVVSRLFAISQPLPGAKDAIRTATADITPKERAGDFAQAMMDLGASLCSVRAPDCLLCPLREFCQAAAQGNPEAYPVKAPKKARPHRHAPLWWMQCGGDVWLEQRPGKGMLGGMRGFPTTGWNTADKTAPQPPVEAQWCDTGLQVEHVFTHFSLDLHIHHALVRREQMDGRQGMWWPADDLDSAGLPTVFAKVARIMNEEPEHECPL